LFAGFATTIPVRPERKFRPLLYLADMMAVRLRIFGRYGNPRAHAA
jgi:hypothetical protein